ncbi:hypothetical protein TNCV_2190531 [Trichonephila clavipes]|uniref:Uncharacterized protein n=1 Tax=Trichonephila clavipes TaxID=2585209 RepID=A0A8X6RDV3_TRICX|nr:hypothetical protein TNCV_2190531 [Trichonephila clavipes]
MVVDLGLDMDDSHDIIMQSCHLCQLAYSSIFPVLRSIYTRISFDNENFSLMTMSPSRERDETFRGRGCWPMLYDILAYDTTVTSS